MKDKALSTHFASPERSAPEELEAEHQRVRATECVQDLLDALPYIAMVVDRHRQVVLANKPLLELLGIDDGRTPVGQRPGEIVGCIHAHEMEAGCGTSESCAVCGAAHAILQSQHTGQKVSLEARITSRAGDAMLPFDLRVTATPLRVQDGDYTVVVMADISDEKRRVALERAFFHDILNTAGAVQGVLELLKDAGRADEVRELLDMADLSTHNLVEQIRSQRSLVLAESGDLALHPTLVSSLEIVRTVTRQYATHEVATDREIAVDAAARNITFETDPVLLSRVLGNMLKNALEASAHGEKATVGCALQNDEVVFWVHNPTYMPRDVQLQVFQRSFSTRGRNRGLGTYGMRLLSERYLKGKISFATSKEEGTTFTARYPLALERPTLEQVPAAGPAGV
jgi:signal transduction histidine kinase